VTLTWDRMKRTKQRSPSRPAFRNPRRDVSVSDASAHATPPARTYKLSLFSRTRRQLGVKDSEERPARAVGGRPTMWRGQLWRDWEASDTHCRWRLASGNAGELEQDHERAPIGPLIGTFVGCQTRCAEAGARGEYNAGLGCSWSLYTCKSTH
jgi:hypothetical protein